MTKFDSLVGIPKSVTPAKAGVQNCLFCLDSGFRRNDGKNVFISFLSAFDIRYSIFCGSILKL
jgi:hypothetical protein